VIRRRGHHFATVPLDDSPRRRAPSGVRRRRRSCPSPLVRGPACVRRNRRGRSRCLAPWPPPV